MTTAAAPAAAGAKPTGRFTRKTEIRDVAIDSILVRDGFNPRTKIEADKLGELAQSIKARGMLTPLLVRPLAERKGGKDYVLVAGHRRILASSLAGLKTVPAIVRDDEAAELEDAVAENFNREDLDPLEEAVAFGRLRDERGLTAKGIAEAVGVAQRRITERLRILDLPAELQQHFATGALSPTSAKPLAEIATFDKRLALLIGKNTVADGRGGTLNDPGYAAWWAVHYGDGKKGELTAITLGGFAGARLDVEALGTMPDEWQRKIDRLVRGAGGYYRVSLNDQAIDALRAAGVLFAPKGGTRGGQQHGVVKDRATLRAVCEPIIQRDFEALVKRDAAKTGAPATGAAAAGPSREDEKAREYSQMLAARAYNLKLGTILTKNFSTVELTPDVVRFLAYADGMIGSGLQGRASKATELFQAGMRYIDERYQTESVVKSTGRTKVAYLSALSGETDVTKLFWTWWKLATTPQEIAGRTIIAYAAACYSRQEVVSSSQQVYRGHGEPTIIAGSENALDALKAIVGKKIPEWIDPTITEVERASQGLSWEQALVLELWATGVVSGASGDVVAATFDKLNDADGVGDEITRTMIKKTVRDLIAGGLLEGTQTAPSVTKLGVDVIAASSASYSLEKPLLAICALCQKPIGAIAAKTDRVVDGTEQPVHEACAKDADDSVLTMDEVLVLHALQHGATPRRGEKLPAAIARAVGNKFTAAKADEALKTLEPKGLVAGGKAPYITKKGAEVAAALDGTTSKAA